VPGQSETIRVRSILGRFLEHSRVFAFANADGTPDDGYDFAGPDVLIGSADLMHRNLDRRVEALVRVSDPDHVTELVDLIDLSMDDGTTSWHLGPDGEWQLHALGPDGERLADLQSVLIARQRRRPGMGR